MPRHAEMRRCGPRAGNDGCLREVQDGSPHLREASQVHRKDGPQVGRQSELWVRTSRKRLAQRLVHYPVLLPSDWVNTLFNCGGHFFLGGRSLESRDTLRDVGAELDQFWRRYRIIDESFPMFADVPEHEWKRSIPVALHGDEGRGKAKTPVMVVSLQCILPLVGKKTNMQGCLGSWRLVWLSCVIIYRMHSGVHYVPGCCTLCCPHLTRLRASSSCSRCWRRT